MEFKQNEWIGNWTNFESYIYSEEPAMRQCWADAEEFAKAMPMFKNGVKSFWEMACNTINEENQCRLGGWKIHPVAGGMKIEWIDLSGKSLGEYHYALERIVEKGLEAKDNFLFIAKDAPITCPFRYLLAMEPMPERSAKENGGLLSHLHFQYASSVDLLLNENKLCKSMWYATMCDADGSLLDRCNIIRTLHRLPRWEKLPE